MEPNYDIVNNNNNYYTLLQLRYQYSLCGKDDGYNLELLSLCEEYEIDVAMLDHRCDHLMHASFAKFMYLILVLYLFLPSW